MVTATTWKLRPRLHRHDRIECWCDPPPMSDRERKLLTTGLAGFCAHGVGMLDQCDACCPPAEVKS